ncbi:MAG TPA: glycosyltransferase family 1 protein [Ruminococcaceae bacterium]|nr:glycosyltransferase family 1 protein [Oscillospiraceae bacterium]
MKSDCMKALFTATVKSHIGQFHMPFIKELQGRGYEVHAAYKDNSNQKQGLDTSAIDKIYEVPFSRSPYSPSNIKAYFALKKIIDENSYDVIHCNTPMGAVITRLAALGARKRGTKVVYTAHGFHFYKGAPRINKILFYPVEKILSRCTDALITINSEDYNAALDHNFKAKKIYHVNGVGVDLSRFHSVSPDKKSALREQYGYSDDDFIMIYPADFCERKNQNMLFDMLKILLEHNKNFKLLLPGATDKSQPYVEYAKSIGVFDNVEILGYRNDISNLVALSDISLSSSRQEGLTINLIEAMAIGNPIVATDVRGNNDLVKNGINGFTVPLNDSAAMADAVMKIYNSPQLALDFKNQNAKEVKNYSVESVIDDMVGIYKDLLLL